jgi:hypothetical protein
MHSLREEQTVPPSFPMRQGHPVNTMNWFVPSPTTVSQMMRDVGYAKVRLNPIIASSSPPDGRILAVGERKSHVDLLRAGLSVRTIR